MLSALRALPLVWRVVTVLGTVAALGGLAWGLYAAVRHDGYVAGVADATARCAAEKAAQRAANEAAIDAANRQLVRLADEAAQKSTELDDALSRLEAAAAADPLGSNLCLGPDSVRRLDALH